MRDKRAWMGMLILGLLASLACQSVFMESPRPTLIPTRTATVYQTRAPTHTPRPLPGVTPRPTRTVFAADETPNTTSDFEAPLSGGAEMTWNGIPIRLPFMTYEDKDNTCQYTTPATVGEVADFYRQQMPARGFTAQDTGPGDGQSHLLAFQKDKTLLTVAILDEGQGVTRVVLNTQ